jgi:hypothetical protein
MRSDVNALRQAAFVSPLAARQYVEAQGWESVRFQSRGSTRLYLYRHPDGGLRQIIIPMDGGDPDYASAIMDAADRLSEFEKRSVAEIVTDLLIPGSDVLRFRVMSPRSETGFLPLTGGISLLEGARRALLSAACSVEHPRSHHPRMTWDEATQMIEACQLGQTEHGSYVVRIACPVDAVDLGDMHNNQPFVRRATRLLFKSSRKLVDAIEGDEVEKLYSSNEDLVTLSSNFCEALLRMRAVDEQSTLSISVDWASTIQPPDGVSKRESVTFNSDYFPVIEEIYERLRNPSELNEAVFVGTVEKLAGTIGEDGRRFGDVVLTLFHEDEILTAHANLDAASYLIADSAHMSGKLVTVQGVLHLGKRVHKIVNPTGFQLLTP